MITRYKDFINENNTVEGITTEEYRLLKKWGIKNYSFNKETGLIDVDGSIFITGFKLILLPEFRLGHVKGTFDCSDNKLDTLEYCPKWVGSDFFCNGNALTSLEYCPKIVGSGFYCDTISKSSTTDSKLSITDYPMCKIGRGISNICNFPKIHELVKKYPERYEQLFDNKTLFHQQVMRDDPSLIPEYIGTSIPIPTKKSMI